MQPEPAMQPGAKGPEGAEGDKGPAKPPRLDEGKGVLVILSNAGLVSDDFSGTRKDITSGATRFINGVNGFAFVSNVVDWLTGSEDVIALRSRGAKSRKFDEVSESTANGIQWMNFLGAPVLVVIAGLLVFFVRRHRS